MRWTGRSSDRWQPPGDRVGHDLDWQGAALALGYGQAVMLTGIRTGHKPDRILHVTRLVAGELAVNSL